MGMSKQRPKVLIPITTQFVRIRGIWKILNGNPHPENEEIKSVPESRKEHSLCPYCLRSKDHQAGCANKGETNGN